MSIDRIRQQLSKMKLTSSDDEQSVFASQAGSWIIFSDAIGDSFLIAMHDDVQRELGAASRGKGKMSREIFWSASWLGMSPFFRGLDELWNALPSDAREATTGIPKSSERQTIGRVKQLSRDWYLLEAESGDYALVPAKDTARWRIE